MNTLRFPLIAAGLLIIAACAPTRHPQAARHDPNNPASDSVTACEPAWTRRVPRDSLYFYVSVPGTAATYDASLERAHENALRAYAARVSASVTEETQYTTRHGNRAAADSAVLLAINTSGMASELDLFENSKVCEVPEGYRVWTLYRASVELTFRRIQQKDSIARNIDFAGEYRKRFRQP